MPEGVIKIFNESKGFVFIKPIGRGEDVFVHMSDLKDQVKEKDEVSYEVQRCKIGPTVVNVKLI